MVELAGLDAAPNYRRADALITLAKDMFPSLQIGDIGRWMGHRPSLPDSLPVIGPAPNHPSLLLAFGHGHHERFRKFAEGARFFWVDRV